MAITGTPIDIPVPEGGIRQDQEAERVDPGALKDARNVIYRDGEMMVRPGTLAFGNDINQRPMGYIGYRGSDGNFKVVKATTAGWWKLGSSTWTDITDGAIPLTGGVLNQQVLRVFQKAGATWLLGVNGKDAMKRWDGGAGNYENVGGSPPIARCMMKLANRILIGNLTSGGTVSPVAVDVSKSLDFDSGWGAQQVALVGDAPGAIVSMMEMGSTEGAIYKEDEIVTAVAQGGGDPFRFPSRMVLESNEGPASALFVVKITDGLHAYLAANGSVKLWNGASLTSMHYRIQKHITKTASLEHLGRGFSIFDAERQELWLIYPLAGATEPSGGAIIKIRTEEIYPIDWPALSFSAGAKLNPSTGLTFQDLTTAFSAITQTFAELGSQNQVRRILLGEVGGQSFHDLSTRDNGAAIPFHWETGLRGKGGKTYTLQEMQHRFKKANATQEVSIEVGVRDYGEERTLTSAETIDIGQAGPYKTEHRDTAAFFSARFSGDATEEVVYRGSVAGVDERGAA